MTCQDREKQLPAYLEGELSPGEAEELKAHLVSCTSCRKTLEDIKKTDRFVQGLAEVDPPPWLKQQIMARVRQEAKEKKGFLQRIFSPLYIKIPVQAFAVIVIAVLAFYVYRQDAPQMRMKGIPLPSAPAFEARKDQKPPLPRLVPRQALAPTGISRPSDEEKPVSEMNPDVRGDITVPQELSEKEAYSLQYGLEKGIPKNDLKSSAPVISEQLSVLKREADGGFFPVMKQQGVERGQPEVFPGEQNKICERDTCLADDKSGAGSVGLPAAKDAAIKDERPSLDLVLTVKDVGLAVMELDKYIEASDPRYTDITVREDKQVFTTELRAPFVGPFLEKLSFLGRPGEYVHPEITKDTQWVKIKISIIESSDHKP